MSRPQADVAFLFDVDNTLLDNDQVTDEMRSNLNQEVGTDRAQHYWSIFEELRDELGYADYLGALQRFRDIYPHDPCLLEVSHFLLDYPFADRLYRGALAVIEHVGQWGPTVLLTDGDVVFQPRKVERSGLFDAVSGRVLIYVHKEKELGDVAERYPAKHYVLIDDKLRILVAIKDAWGPRVTTVFVRQGHYATNKETLARYAKADVTIEAIENLLSYNLAELISDGD